MLLAGCAAAHKPAAVVKPAPLSDADGMARARAFLQAIDTRDSRAFRAAVGTGFVLFEDGHARSADALSKGWAASNKKGWPTRKRTCDVEQIRRSGATVVYVADCKEHIPAFGKRRASDWQGWNTVVMTREDGAWKVAFWQWVKSGVDAQRARWNDAYRKAAWYTKDANKFLMKVADKLAPGSALVLAMGQGRNALYLAARGWQVTGVDMAEVGLAKARKTAAARKLSLNAVLANIDKYDFGRDKWDLVTMLYAGNSGEWIKRIKTGLKPGGRFVVEFFHGKTGFTAEGLAKQFVGWTIEHNQEVEDIADWGMRKAKLVRFVARKPN